MKKRALIVFVKNILLGKVKTRLAKTVGDFGAFEVYKYLVDLTETETSRLETVDLKIYFSDTVIESKWPNADRYEQLGDDLGERLYNAYSATFKEGYDQVVAIGSDLPGITAEIVLGAFESLDRSDFVIGPADDGGYYLLGMNEMRSELFRNKSWSTDNLFEETRKEIAALNVQLSIMSPMNDIDTLEDLIKSNIADKFAYLNELSRSDK